MKTLILAVTLIAVSAAAWAQCPRGTRYECTQGFGGKVICGCR